MTRQRVCPAATVLGVLLLAGPAAAGQASMLDASEASAFMGTWVIAMESPRGGGTRDQTVVIRDEGGKAAARIEGGRGGALDITDIAKDGDSLILSFEAERPWANLSRRVSPDPGRRDDQRQPGHRQWSVHRQRIRQEAVARSSSVSAGLRFLCRCHDLSSSGSCWFGTLLEPLNDANFSCRG